MAAADSIITPETSKRICKHMNEDHLVSVYGMALRCLERPGWILQDCQMQKISAKGCEFRAVLCSGKLCQLENVTYPFNPPLDSSAEARPRLVAIHKRVCRPNWKWLFAPLPVFLIFMTIFLFYCMYIGLDQVENIIIEDEATSQFVAMVFGTPKIFTTMVWGGFWFLVVAHMSEASYAAYQCQFALKFGVITSLEWFIATALVGFPMLGHLLEFVSASRKNQKSSESTNKKAK